MIVGVPRENRDGERRVAATPHTVATLAGYGFDVVIESGAGVEASFPDAGYVAAGATLDESGDAAWGADLVLRINAPTSEEVARLAGGKALIGFLWPAQSADLLEQLKAKGTTALSMDCVPRITRAQKCDALSSLANIAGYRAVIEAANQFGSFFTGQFTAAGKVAPAKVLVIGAGVAGLAALGAARGLGAIVRAFDTRTAVKEQVESLGGEFLVLEFEESGEGKGGYAKVMSEEFIAAEMALFRQQAPEIDIVITTALIPGRPAPKLWMTDMVELMKPGSVVVDLAAAQGGNCEVTEPGRVIRHAGVTIIGYTDLTSRLATTASQLYGTNLTHLIDDMGRAHDWKIDLEDEVVRGALVTHAHEITWPPPSPAPKPDPAPALKEEASPAPKPEPAPVVSPPAATQEAEAKRSWSFEIAVVLAVGLWLWARTTVTGGASPATAAFVHHLTVFVLACFVGWQVVWNVTAALHTPLMSVTNAISGIILVGGMLQARGEASDPALILGAVAVLLATINVAGGFLVTERMLKMFRK